MRFSVPTQIWTAVVFKIRFFLIEIRLELLELEGGGGVKWKNDLAALTGALLVAMPRRQYEPVPWSETKHRSETGDVAFALAEMHLIHAWHFKIKVICQVKVRSKVKMKRFHILGSRVG